MLLSISAFYQSSLEWLQSHLLTCWFKKIFHVDCPGCGFQRSLIELMKGDLKDSFHLYPATFPILFILAFTVLNFRFKFRFGTKLLNYSYLFTTALILVSYGIKLSNPHF